MSIRAININDVIFEQLYKKDVALIGGAPSADLFEAEKADFIVYVNNHWLKYHGRIDAAYMCSAELPSFPVEELLFLAFARTGGHGKEIESICKDKNVPYLKFAQGMYKGANPYGPECEWINSFSWELGTHPFTGAIAMKHLLSFPIKSLYVTGFTFWEKDGVVPRLREPHLVVPNMEYFIRTYETNQVVEFDANLLDVLSRWKNGEIKVDNQGVEEIHLATFKTVLEAASTSELPKRKPPAQVIKPNGIESKTEFGRF